VRWTVRLSSASVEMTIPLEWWKGTDNSKSQPSAEQKRLTARLVFGTPEGVPFRFLRSL